jgi:hypothetical protein
MGSLAAYLKLVQADVKSNAAVYFDTVQSTTSSVSVETGSTTTGTDAANVILLTTPGSGGVTTGNNAVVKQQRAWSISPVSGIGVILTIAGAQVLHNGSAYGTVTTTGNLSLDLVALKSSLATSRATTLGTTLNVKTEGTPTMPSVVFPTSVTSASNGENYTNDQVAAIGLGTNNALVTSWDNFTITIDGLSATASITTASATGAAAKNAVASRLAQAWAAKYNAAGTASGDLSLWTANGDTTSGTIAIALKSTLTGSRGFGKSVSIAWAKATAAQVSAATAGVVSLTSDLVMDWTIGATAATDDNSSTANSLILTLTEVTGSVAAASGGATVTFVGAGGGTELGTTNVLYTPAAGTDTTTSANIYVTDARGDVVNREGANEGTTSATVARVSTDRSQWTFTAG